MSADADTAPDPPGQRADARDPGNSYRDNQQRLDRGLAVMGGITGDVIVITGAPPDEDATDSIVKPRLREGPYPAADVQARLRGFVEPLAYAQCRKILDSHILVLRAGGGAGASTTAFALLAERHGVDGITGLDSPDDLRRWSPKEGRGYLLQSLSPAAATSLSEVLLMELAAALRRLGAHLVITVRAETALQGGTTPWQVVHRPPKPADVVTKRLNIMVKDGELTPDQSTEALRHLASASFASHLHAHPLPQDGVDTAQGLRDLVANGKPAASVLHDLQTGSPAAARRALAESCHQAGNLSLMASISLLAEQDRTVIEEFSAILRPHIDERDGPMPATDRPQSRNVLGPAFEDRLEAVGACLLPSRFGAAQRYPVQPVVFSGRHRSDALLRCLWLDYEGMARLLWRALEETPHHPGIELAAGQAIGRVLAHATGPNTLRQLRPFAESDMRWRRRLVAYALGEMVQDPALTGAVREQLRQWSRVRLVPLRCTVAETCAGSFGLARPSTALKLLDAVLDEPDKDLADRLRTAVSFALSTLLSEDVNHTLVLDCLREWQEADPGTQRHAMAVHVIESMCLTTFPRPSAPGVRRLRLADLLANHREAAFALVVTALDDPVTHDTMAAGLSLIERNPEQRQRSALPQFLVALSAAARSHRGVLRFVLRRHRARTSPPAEGFTP
ncbi:hypothetical protein [Streptomyces sp. RKAG337]|uniref:hypothetical protein n=1 Tax=Streptomyces sp. RKAG337 TaxID=2893404 RepID=UPI0020337922|nr:hypothetical protein [Streptomyces sp. RKAG337]MCM2424822.1 hypothetical protein [Streptomyces sp. RKAG337]